MEKTFLAIIFIMNSFNIYSQNLVGSKWIKVNEERKDGSIIHYRKTINIKPLEYYFKSINKLEITNWSKYSVNYKLENSELTIETQKYDVEKLNSDELIICEKSEKNIANDKKNRYYFVNSERITDYVIEKKLIPFENDSTVISNFILKPKLKNNKELDFVLTKSLANKNIENGCLGGSFLINTKGKVENIKVTSVSNISETSVDEFKKTLKRIKFKPLNVKKAYYQRVNFNIVFKGLSNFFSSSIETDTQDLACVENNRYLSSAEKEQTHLFFKEGCDLFVKKKYKEAIESFDNTIKIDSLFFDAYYNRAYTSLILNNIENACKDWEYLARMGQKEGSVLYNKKCK